MGLASTMNTALTGLSAAETSIDVVGNNLANANTVGFKESTATFANQFLQTQSLGSAPTDTNGGTNPRQLGLGTEVVSVTPNFTQGTIQVSANPTDLAIQGDGLFIVQGNTGEEDYTRNGVFKLNAESELVNATGARLLGYGVDDQYQLDSTVLQPLTIPLGSAAVAEATQNAYLQGTLTPTGDVATTGQIVKSAILGDGSYTAPTTKAKLTGSSAPTITTMHAAETTDADGHVDTGTYNYRIVYADGPMSDATSTEGAPSVPTATVTVDGTNNAVTIDNWPTTANYSYARFYRTLEGAGNAGPYYFAGEAAMGDSSFVDKTADSTIQTGPQLNDDTLSGNYSYYVTFAKKGGVESCPSPLTGPINIVNGRIQLTQVPTGDASEWDVRRIYRNLASNDGEFHLVTEIDNVDDATVTFTDNKLDSDIIANQTIDMDGPKITANTLLTDVIRRDGSSTTNVFDVGTLHLTGRKGGKSLTTKDLTITSSTTVLDWLNFTEQALGIHKPPGPDTLNPIPIDSSGSSPGASVTTDGRIQIVSNNGVDNAIGVDTSGMRLTTADGDRSLSLPFTTTQSAVGNSAVTDFIAYDSLGIPLSVRITADLESRTSSATTYRWYADCGDNDPTKGVQIGVGTGTISFDGQGNLLKVNGDTVSIDRSHIAAASPLEFTLDFSKVSGLATSKSTLAVSRQDGSAPGVLSSFTIGEDGRIKGAFSNGVSRDLGQIRLVRFGNPAGLEQRGENLYAAGANSGLPVEGNPGEQGIGTIVAGATERSNADIGSNLIELITASTMYRGNARVITTAQQMLDELLNLRR